MAKGHFPTRVNSPLYKPKWAQRGQRLSVASIKNGHKIDEILIQPSVLINFSRNIEKPIKSSLTRSRSAPAKNTLTKILLPNRFMQIQ